MATTTPAHNIETFLLGDRPVPRIWVGLWQLSSPAWGTAPAARIRREMARHVERGYTAFGEDTTPLHFILDSNFHIPSSSSSVLETDMGQYRASLPPQQANGIIGATKWCVFRQTVPTRAVVEAAVRERMSRMRTERVDFLQFHWQDYNDKAYLTALKHLADLRAEGVISGIGLVNFDAIRTDEICTEMAGYRSPRTGNSVIMTNQIQFSLIDTRPLHGMSDVCKRHGIKLLTYGTLCGGFLADKWLGQPEPDAYKEHMTPSQRKYLDVILTAWGGWALFQQLLSVLKTIGNKHGASIANVATRWVLDHDCVGAVIIGARLGVSEHIDDNQNIFGWTLSDEDKAAVEDILDRSNGRRMITTIGDCGAEYRNVFDAEEKRKGDGETGKGWSGQVTETAAGTVRVQDEGREKAETPEDWKNKMESRRQGQKQPVVEAGLKRESDRDRVVEEVVGQEGTESDGTTAVGGDAKDDPSWLAKRRLSSSSVTLALILGFGAILVMLTWEADLARNFLR